MDMAEFLNEESNFSIENEKIDFAKMIEEYSKISSIGQCSNLVNPSWG